MDTSIAPGTNFYEYANGNWRKSNPIPPGYPSWNTFTSLHVQSQEHLKTILEELSSAAATAETTETTATTTTTTTSKEDEKKYKVSTFYQAALDEQAIEQVGLEPFQPILDLIETTCIQNHHSQDFAHHLGTFASRFGLFPFFSIDASPDHKESSYVLCQIMQGGLGLPDRDYYFDETKADKREAYIQHIAHVLSLLSSSLTKSETMGSEDVVSSDTTAMAHAIYNIECALAKNHMTKTENRDPEQTYNKMSVAELRERCGAGKFDYAAYLEAATHGKIPKITTTTTNNNNNNNNNIIDSKENKTTLVNVRNVEALQTVASVISTIEPTTLRGYLQWTALRSLSPYMTKAFVDANFDFYEKTLSGTNEIKPRWKRAMAFTEAALGEILGELYCARHFDESCKERALWIVEQVRQALEARLHEVEWMTSEETRQAALEKMKRFKVKIGYPDKWINYSNLRIDATDDCFLTMILKSNAFHHQRTVDEMNAPTDRSKWFMTPQTVNAYYHPSLNEIVFPAAILQPPFFDINADDAVNFGAMGSVVGHEMTHGFDDKGRKFDADGNLRDWWTPADAEEYEKRVQVMVEQANAYKVYGQAVQGKLTCGENIADLGGLRLALRALQAQNSSIENESIIDGFSPIQRFFLGWAQCWRQNVTKDRAIQLLMIDPHGPNEMRCNGPLSNMPEFHAAFGVTENDPLYRNVSCRVNIW
jgi:putative endopeptidase